MRTTFIRSVAPRAILVAAFGLAGSAGQTAWGDIDYLLNSPLGSGVIPGTQGITPGPGVDLSGWNTPGQNLEYANLSNLDLSTASFAQSDLTLASFASSNLTNASLNGATVTNANLTGATVTGADFGGALGFVPSQLYSTASYVAGDLTGIGLETNDLTGWSFANQNLTNAEFYNSTLVNADFANASLSDADFYQSTMTSAILVNSNLNSADFFGSDLTTANLASADLNQADLYTANLSNVNFAGANLTGADFTGANISGANFSSATGFTADQLYSTANYSGGSLSGVGLEGLDLTGSSFAGQNFAGGDFASTNLTGADLSGANLAGANFAAANLTSASFADADLRGASDWSPGSSTNVQNAILPDGSIRGLSLQAGEELVVRNSPIAIAVTTAATFDPASTLQFQFSPDWTSPIGFAAGLTPSLSGTLDLELAPGVDPAELIGDSFQLFEWNTPLPAGDEFLSITTDPRLNWDLSELYTTGIVSVSAVPEPASATVLGVATAALLARRRRNPAKPGR